LAGLAISTELKTKEGTINSNSLKIVVLYDEDRKVQTRAAQFDPRGGRRGDSKVGEQKLRAMILPQSRQHRGDRAQECRACRDAARNVSLPDSTEGEVLAGVPEADNAEMQGDDP
jgi:hypothetical protein